MKSVFYYFLFLLLVSSNSSRLFGQQQEFKIQAIAFYNLENLFHPSDEPGKFDDDFTAMGSYRYTDDIYKKKLKNMAYALSQIAIDEIAEGPAIIGLAEIENKLVLQDLVKQAELADRNLKFVHFDSPDSRGIDVALLYHPKYFKLISAKALPVYLSQNGKKINTRDVLYVIGLLSNDTVHVLVNHWTSRYGGASESEWKRIKAAEVNKTIIDSLHKANPKSRILVMGDFNDNPENKSIATTMAASGSKLNVAADGLYNPWMSLHKKGLGTSTFKNNWFLFDQILVSKELINPNSESWRFYKAEIFNKKFLINPFGKNKGQPHRSYLGTRWIDGFSDHLPVLIYLIK